MSYTPTNWSTGDTITAEKLNKMESGIEKSFMVIGTTVGPSGISVDLTYDECLGLLHDNYHVVLAVGPANEGNFLYCQGQGYDPETGSKCIIFSSIMAMQKSDTKLVTLSQVKVLLLEDNTNVTRNEYAQFTSDF